MPVLRAGQTLGVLVVQDREQRAYGGRPTLLTTATILAEMVATSDFDSLIKSPVPDIDLRRPRSFRG